MKESDEFLVLQKYFKNLGSQYNDSSGILIGPGDDAGLFFSKNTDLIYLSDSSNQFYKKWTDKPSYINVTMRAIRKIQCDFLRSRY
mgnify:CR=1 FL=1